MYPFGRIPRIVTMTKNQKTVCIIGGGPGGLAAARVLSKDFPEAKITLIEKEEDVGGVWYYPENNKEGRVMYDYLETNLSKDLMKFSGFPFKDDVPFYPRKNQVFDYLKEYYQTYIKNHSNVDIELETEVINVDKNSDKWILTTKHANSETVREFDFVIVSNGHFKEPKYPKDVSGLDSWLSNGKAFHSKDFYNCEFAKDKKIIVVGNGSSGSDIANQISTVAAKVYVSVTNVEDFKDKNNDPEFIVEYIPKIKSVGGDDSSVKLEDGRVIENIDYIIYATGYLYSLPFFASHISEKLLKSDQSGITNLWEQCVYKEDPTLGFLLLSIMVVPFPLAESQSTILSQVFQGNIDIATVTPSRDEVEHEKNYGHNFPKLSDIDFYRELQDILDKHGSNTFKPVVWDEVYEKKRKESAEVKQQRNEYLAKHAQKLHKENRPYYLPDNF